MGDTVISHIPPFQALLCSCQNDLVSSEVQAGLCGFVKAGFFMKYFSRLGMCVDGREEEGEELGGCYFIITE